MTEKILLGFEVPSGAPVYIPLRHSLIAGITQISGKTTTIEALIYRSKVKAVVFKTKRGETGFETAGKTLPLYFRERSDWKYVSSLIEARLGEKLKFERSWIMRACKHTHSLREVLDNITELLESKKLRGIDKSVYTTLEEYLKDLLPEIEKLPTTDKIEIGPGVNVMDLESMYHQPEIQAIFIRSVMEHVLANEKNVVIVVPEAWKFLPQGRSTPVKAFFIRFVREGAAVGNFLWLDSQDIAGVDKAALRQVDNWILGRQKEFHEVERTIEAIPLPKKAKPTSLQIRHLKLGHFYAACGDQVKLVYVLPADIPPEIGRDVALGKLHPEYVQKRITSKVEEVDEELWKKRYETLKKEFDALQITHEAFKASHEAFKKEYDTLKRGLQKLEASPVEVKGTVESAPSEIVVNVEQPELSVKVERKALFLTDEKPEGRVAIVYAEGELPSNKWFSTKHVNIAFNAHGWPENKRIGKILDRFCQWGFFEKQISGFRPEYRLKMTPEEAKAKGLLKTEEVVT